MEIYFQLVNDAEGIKKAYDELSTEEYLGFDTETTELDPYEGNIRLVQFSNGKNTYVIDLKPFADKGDLKTSEELALLRELLTAPRPIKIAHNAKFDAKWVRHHLGVDVNGIFDTLLASQLIAAGDQDRRHNLAEVVNFFLGVELDKTEQVSDWSADELSQSQIQYAAKDAAIMVALREKVVDRLKQDNLVRVAKLEFDCVMPIAQMELNGFYLDEARWREQLEKVKKEQDRIAMELQRMLAAGVAQASLFGVTEINLDSNQQVLDALKNLGVPVPNSTRGYQLEPLALEYPVVAKLLEYRGVAKAISSFGETILEFIKPQTGRLHSDFRQIGAPTGRFSSSKPNIQQIPHEEAYRRCFRAPEGRKLVIADYSQIELRILADFSNDENFINAFKSGADFHTITAAQVFNVAPEKVSPEQRSFAKRLNFGVVYGIGAQRFALMTGLSQTQAEDTMRKYFGTYRGLDAWLRDAARKVVSEKTSRTASGRLYKFRFEDGDRAQIGAAQRNGKNFPIQGCVHGNTKIFEKRRGYISIKDLVNQKVCVWDGERFSKAFVAYSGKKQLVNIEFWGGNFIQCSPEHKFLTIDVNGRSKWRKPDDFVKGNYVVLSETVGDWSVDLNVPKFQAGKVWNASKMSITDSTNTPFDLGVWLGRLASDGSIVNHQLYLLVARHEEIILPYIKNLTSKFGHIHYQLKKSGLGTQMLHFLTVSALGLVNQLKDSGIKNRIPDFVWQNSRILAGYLRGMFDGDGTVLPDGAVLSFGQKDKHLSWAREIHQALLLLGIRSRINRCADRVNVCVCKKDMPIFTKQVGFINPVKQTKAEKILPIKKDSKIYGRAVRIKSVEFTDEYVDMYDVVNSETERFMANGLITHNSSADILKRALHLLHSEITGTSTKLVNIVHDEVILECDAAEAEEVCKILEKAMCDAGEEYVKKVPVKVDAHIADEWTK
ncbi:MAG TPA: DNA polymerase [Pyrinomonadaceae bacterium]|nr:DNA polymerase [Pyrinomonadaceae bacterium]